MNSLEIMDSIIDINCIGCPEFNKDIRKSQCICEPIMDIIEREGIECEIAGILFEKVRKTYLL